MSKRNPDPQTYRGKNVTGALAFVKELSADLWTLMPEADRPKTDREAARHYLATDRSGPTLGELVSYLEDRRKAEEAKAAKIANPRRLPDSLTLSAAVYDKLRALVQWIDDTPADIELSEHTWDYINSRMCDVMEEHLNTDESVVTMQIETAETSQRGIEPGTLVALLENPEADDDAEYHVKLLRGT